MTLLATPFAACVFALTIALFSADALCQAAGDHAVASLRAARAELETSKAGLKFDTVLVSKKNGQPLATVRYAFTLKGVAKLGAGGNSEVSMSLSPLHLSKETGGEAVRTGGAGSCIVRLTQGQVEVASTGFDDVPENVVLSRDQQDASLLIMGLLFFGLGDERGPAGASGAEAETPRIKVVCPSPKIKVADATVTGPRGGAFHLVFGDGDGRGEAPPNAVGDDKSLPTYSGTCDCDATSGWVRNLSVIQEIVAGKDHFTVQIEIKAIRGADDETRPETRG